MKVTIINHSEKVPKEINIQTSNDIEMLKIINLLEPEEIFVEKTEKMENKLSFEEFTEIANKQINLSKDE